MIPSSDHLEPELLSAYLDGMADITDRPRIEAHLGTCDVCQTELASLRATVALLQRLPAVRAPRTFYLSEAMLAPPPARSLWSWLPRWRGALGALSAVATLLFLMVWSGTALPGAAPATSEPEISLMREAEPMESAEEGAPESAEGAVAQESSAASADVAATELLTESMALESVEEGATDATVTESARLSESAVVTSSVAKEGATDDAALSADAPPADQPAGAAGASQPAEESADSAAADRAALWRTPLLAALLLLAVGSAALALWGGRP